MVVHDLLDQTHVLQSPHGLSGQRTVDLHSLDEDRLGDHLVGRDLLEDLVAVRGRTRISSESHVVSLRRSGGFVARTRWACRP